MFLDYRKQERYSREYLNSAMLGKKRKESQYILNRLDGFVKGKKKVLDVGCGVGVLGREIKKRYCSDVWGIDINKVAVRKAIELGIDAKVTDIESKWPFQDNSFDLVVMVQVIEHVLNTDSIIVEARRVLKKGGLLLITTPNLASWFNRIIFLFGYQPFFTEVSLRDKTLGLKFTRRFTKNTETVGHIRVFTLKGLLDLLEYHKFQIKLSKGGKICYLPPFMEGFDNFFSMFPSLAADLIVVACKLR